MLDLRDSRLMLHASLLANERRHSLLCPVHVLMAASYRGDDTGAVLMELGIDLRELRTDCRQRMESIKTSREMEISTATVSLLARAETELTHGLSHSFALLVALTGDDADDAGQILASNFVTIERLREAALRRI
jgi:hypothetical protein